jgi:hypothetical protein
MIVNNKLGVMWEETFLANFKAQLCYLSGKLQKDLRIVDSHCCNSKLVLPNSCLVIIAEFTNPATNMI